VAVKKPARDCDFYFARRSPACVNLDAFPQRVVNQLGADCGFRQGVDAPRARGKERAMADKSEYVDTISEATRQLRRRYAPRLIEPEVKETSRLSHWPPDRWVQWRVETLTPWKLKSWKFKNWD
jgi:hypothetical protein